MVKIIELQNGQKLITIPKKIAEVMRWKKGDTIEFEVMGKDKLKIERKQSLGGKQGGSII